MINWLTDRISTLDSIINELIEDHNVLPIIDQRDELEVIRGQWSKMINNLPYSEGTL